MAAGSEMRLEFTKPPRRVVSLVPSMTESLFDLGLGEALVGATDFCIHPADQIKAVPRVGGTKDPRITDLLALQPDLVIANQEENSQETVAALKAAGIKVWLTFPKSVRGMLDALWILVGIFRSEDAAVRLQTLEMGVEWARAASESLPHFRYFCPIWQDQLGGTDWWMTFNQDTYASDLLSLFGGENVFAMRRRRYPLASEFGIADEEPVGERDTRYPRVTAEEIRASAPDLILLPDEPFVFGEEHRQQFLETWKDLPAGKNQQIYCVDGTWIAWYGTRIGKAIEGLSQILQH
ncbi:MAG: helical backbone metal receptor [Anaerolineaceae bacterium]